jgi:uncharacterized cupredoxin-like copper-binding protein
MKKTILVFLIGVLPALAVAGGNGDDPHDTDESDAVATPATEQHGHASENQGHDANPQGHDAKPQGHDANPQGHDAKPHGHESVAGRPGKPADITRTVDVTMNDTMRFAPNQLTFDEGETVRFSLQNKGLIPHEFVIGSMSELKEHAEMMRAMPAMQHAEANMLTLEAGAKGDIVWQFDKTGTVDFACLIAGHLEAGMKGSITVE